MARSLGVSKEAFRWNLKQKSFPFPRFIKLLNELGIDTDYAFSKVRSLYVWGSRNPPINVQRWLSLDDEMVQLMGLYHAEGDRNTSKLIITNSEQSVVSFLKRTLTKMFPGIEARLVAIDPIGGTAIQSMDLPISRRKFGKYNKITKYRVIIYSAVICRIISGLARKRIEDILMEKDLAIAWARGILAGEGTVRNSRERYVRVEMKDEFAIRTLSRILNLVDISHKISERKDRPGMWVAYVGAKDLQALSDAVGFGCHIERQKKLETAAARS